MLYEVTMSKSLIDVILIAVGTSLIGNGIYKSIKESNIEKKAAGILYTCLGSGLLITRVLETFK